MRRLPGRVRATRRASIGFDVAGTLAYVGADVGDRFDSGEVLARLEERDYALAAQRARALVEESRAVAREAESDFERRRELAEEKFVSRAALDNARAALETARSRVDTAEASLALAEEELADTELLAPYAGSVSARLAEPSQQVAAGQPIFRIQGSSHDLEVVVYVPESFVHRLRPGSHYSVTFPARPGLDVTGTITEIGSDATHSNAYPATLLLAEADELPLPGMTAEVTFPLDAVGNGVPAAQLVVIPVAAFLPVTGDDKVAFVFDESSGTLERRRVTVVELSGDSALVGEGLEAGEIIASKGLQYLRDGEKVLLMGHGAARSQQEDPAAGRAK